MTPGISTLHCMHASCKFLHDHLVLCIHCTSSHHAVNFFSLIMLSSSSMHSHPDYYSRLDIFSLLRQRNDSCRQQLQEPSIARIQFLSNPVL